jgi:hypothetical protein
MVGPNKNCMQYGKEAHLGGLDVDGSIMLKLTLQKYVVKWIELAYDRVQWRIFVNTVRRCLKMKFYGKHLNVRVGVTRNSICGGLRG